MTRSDSSSPVPAREYIPALQAHDGSDDRGGRQGNDWLASCLSDCWGPRPVSDRTSEKPLPELSGEALSRFKEKLNLPDHETASAVRRDINRYGTSPADTSVELMGSHRVLGMGEYHEGGSHFRATGNQVIERLQAAGATHLAVEMPANLKPLYDEFERTGKIPDGMLTGFWNTEDFRNLVTAARDAGMKVVPVDLPKPWDGRWSKRDPHMAGAIGEILESDPKNKVVAWLGAMHLANMEGTANDTYTTAGTILKDRYPGQVATMNHVRLEERLLGLTSDIRRPVAVKTEGNAVGALKESVYLQQPGVMSHDHWDYSVIYPLENGHR